MDSRTIAGLGLGATLVIAGTLGTGLLPADPLPQLVAGGSIVAGFAVVFATIGLGDWNGRGEE